MRSRRIVCVFLLLFVAVAAFCMKTAAGQESPPAQGHTPSNAPAAAPDLEDGKRQFQQNCSQCHGVNGDGEEGPDLHGVVALLGDSAVHDIIRRGIAGTAMPGSSTASEKQIMDIVGYLRTLNRAEGSEKISGDPARGQTLYNSSGCPACHMIDGQGGSIGPDLSRIGAMRGSAGLKARLLDPGANLPRMEEGLFTSSWTQYLMFRALEKDGHAIEGMRVGEDSFTIVLKDARGKFHALWKPDLRLLEKEPGKSFMPSFKGTLSDAQLDDLVAYLMTLKNSP